jgi:hypothetical protein
MKALSLGITALSLALLTSCVYGGILAGPIIHPASGHVYYLLTQNTWTASQLEARNLGGDLVTIQDAAEQNWVFTNFASFGGTHKALWIGLTDSDAEGVFQWASRQDSSYNNWNGGEPNNSGNEDYVHMNPPTFPNAGTWNDLGNVSSFVAGGFTIPMHGVVEVDPVVLAGPLVNPANGHAYYLLTANDWLKSEAEAMKLRGHLVTINDAAEQDWVFKTFTQTSGPPRGFWIGLNDLGHEGLFTWVSGESATYRNWAPGEPNNGGPTQNESFAHIWPFGSNAGTPGLWNDLPEYTNYANFTLHGVVEVGAVRPGDCEAPPVGLVGWWPGDGNVRDLAGTNTAVRVNASFDPGFVDQAFNFTGSGSYVRVPPSPALAVTNTLSLEAWVWQDRTNQAVSRFLTITPDNVILSVTSGRFSFSLALAPNNTAAFHVVAAANSVEAQKWYHLVATYDGTNQSLYVNGTLAATALVGPPLVPIGQGVAPELFISFLSPQGLDGMVDEAALYNRALTPLEVRSHFVAGRAGMCKVTVFSDIETFFPGLVQLSIKGPPLESLQVHSSTNFVDWSPLTTVSNFTGAVQVSDPLAGAFTRRFYRAFAP